jgi:hypothetical protein
MELIMVNRKTFLKCQEKTSHYTWENDWVSPLESPWSLFEKFRYTNALTNREFFNNFCLDDSSKAVGFISNKHKDLIRLSTFDKNKLSAAFNFDVITFNNENILRLLEVEEEHLEYYLDKKLRYCSTCIKDGFHSLFHQYKEIDTCPYHNLKLQNSCKDCDRYLLFQLDEKYNREPFKCICGLKMLGKDNNYVSWEWKTFQLSEINDPILNSWLVNKKISLRQYLFNISIKKGFEKLFN